MSCQLCPPDLPTRLERANTAWQRAQDALVALAKALLTQNSSSIKRALDKAKDKQDQAQKALKDLEDAKKDLKTPAEVRGTLGDEDEQKLWIKADEVEQEAKRLEEEKEWTQKYQKWLRAGHGLALGLMVLSGAVLSLEAVRTALGVAEDSHLLLALGAVAVSCQVAAQALATSRGHLDVAAHRHHATAQSLRDYAQQVATAKANAKAAAATRADIADAEGRLEAVILWLGELVAAVNEDREAEEQKFTAAADALEDILIALKKTPEGHGELAKTLKDVNDELGEQK